MVTVAEAEKIIQSTTRSFGTECIEYDKATGRVLAEDIKADRDLPPFNRVTMDGIAIQYKSFEEGNRQFNIIGTQAAGENTIDIVSENECIEIMTGAALSASTNTIVRYEDLEIKNEIATIICENIKLGQNIHYCGSDKKKDEVIVRANQYISPQTLSIAASVGKEKLIVKSNPLVAIISTGDELVDIGTPPSYYQIRSSNLPLIKAVLYREAIHAETLLIKDDPEELKKELGKCLQMYDVIIITGGVSMGKFDHVPAVLEDLAVKNHFRKVLQKPGKPFWFGKHCNGPVVFAFPGNPISSCLCLYRYFLPWVRECLGVAEQKKVYANLFETVSFTPELTYFLPVKIIINEEGKLMAIPIKGNGSGDYSTLPETDGFLELPGERDNFERGEVFRLWNLHK